jgi:hypothetical protein
VVDLYMDWLNQFTPDHELPPELQLRDLILRLLDAHPSTTLVRHVHKAQTRSSTMSGNNGNNQRYGNNSGNGHGASNRQLQSTTNGYSGNTSRQFYSGGSVHCVCGMWGHDKDNCHQLAMVAACMDYIKANPAFCGDLVKRWRQSQDC